MKITVDILEKENKAHKQKIVSQFNMIENLQEQVTNLQQQITTLKGGKT
jgi:phage shock protein A